MPNFPTTIRNRLSQAWFSRPYRFLDDKQKKVVEKDVQNIVEAAVGITEQVKFEVLKKSIEPEFRSPVIGTCSLLTRRIRGEEQA